MPGHGTVPGALLKVAIVLTGSRPPPTGLTVSDSTLNELYVVGYSNGAAVILDYLDANRNENLIHGLIFLSPGLRASNAQVVLAPYPAVLVALGE